MSVESWLEEFMPTHAKMCETDLDAVKHARRKWPGLRSEALERHGVEKYDATLAGDSKRFCDRIEINSLTCGLCHIHLGWGEGCGTCPLKIMLNASCDEYDDSPYRVWLETGDPEPMIEALRLLDNKLQFEEEARGEGEPMSNDQERTVYDGRTQVTPKVNGTSFRCECGCNVFTKLWTKGKTTAYCCNSCKATFKGE